MAKSGCTVLLLGTAYNKVLTSEDGKSVSCVRRFWFHRHHFPVTVSSIDAVLRHVVVGNSPVPICCMIYE
jgi:hypothetical protein